MKVDLFGHFCIALSCGVCLYVQGFGPKKKTKELELSTSGVPIGFRSAVILDRAP